YKGLGLVSFVVFGALLDWKLIDMCLQGCHNINVGVSARLLQAHLCFDSSLSFFYLFDPLNSLGSV
ncbi:hypothetical protein TorRG33x02_037590, partial [Trema orientale]